MGPSPVTVLSRILTSVAGDSTAMLFASFPLMVIPFFWYLLTVEPLMVPVAPLMYTREMKNACKVVGCDRRRRRTTTSRQQASASNQSIGQKDTNGSSRCPCRQVVVAPTQGAASDPVPSEARCVEASPQMFSWGGHGRA